MKFFIHLFVILAIATAGISPACAFAGSQKGWLEICASDGTIKKVKVSDDFLPDAPEHGEKSQHSSNIMEDCAFCVFMATGKAFKSDILLQLSSISSGYLKIGSSTFIPENQDVTAFLARGPPIFS